MGPMPRVTTDDETPIELLDEVAWGVAVRVGL
jgi:hypothetical protein